VKDLFACQEAKRDFLLAWFAESHDNVVENISSKDHLTYHEAKEHILNLPSNHWFSLRSFRRTPSLNTRLTPSLHSNGMKGQEEEERVFLLFQFGR
jgi:hypothetical protein